MKKLTIILCAILICFIGYSAFRIHSADANELQGFSWTTSTEGYNLTNIQNTLYDKYLSVFNYCQPIEISNSINFKAKDFSTSIDKLNIKKVNKSNILLYSRKNLNDISSNKDILKDTNILVLKEIGTSPKFNFYIYDGNDLLHNITKPMISGEIQNNQILDAVYN